MKQGGEAEYSGDEDYLDEAGHSNMSMGKDANLRKALMINPKFVDKNIYETLDRLNSYDLHMRRLN